MTGKSPLIQHRLNEQIKRLATRLHAHFVILFKHREFLWL